MKFEKPKQVSVISINPQNLQYMEVFLDIPVIDTDEVFEEVKKYTKFNNTVIVITTVAQFGSILQTKIIDSNIEEPKIVGTLFHYALEMLLEKQHDLVELFNENKEIGINDFEKEAFKRLISNYDNLILAKTTLDGIPTMAICESIEGEVDTQLKPIAIIVNEEIFKKLSAPDSIEDLTK